MEAWSLHQWTVRKVPDMTFLKRQNYKDGEWIGGGQEGGEEGRWAWLPKRSGRGPSDGLFCISTTVVAQATRVEKSHTHTYTHTHRKAHDTGARWIKSTHGTNISCPPRAVRCSPARCYLGEKPGDGHRLSASLLTIAKRIYNSLKIKTSKNH